MTIHKDMQSFEICSTPMEGMRSERKLSMKGT